MPLHKTEAVILQSKPYGEADKIVTFFTRDYGRMVGIAKSARRSQRRFGNTLEICSHVRLTFFEKETRPMVRLEHCDLIQPFPGLREDILRLAGASYFLELVNELTGERMKNENLFDLLLHFLDLIVKMGPKEELRRLFEIRLLTLLGYQPLLHSCVKCRKALSGERFFFGPQQGGVLCPNCSGSTSSLIPISMGTLKTLHLAQMIPLEQIQRISFSLQCLKESQEILSNFLRQYLGKILKSEKFFEHMALS
jgi:DNA repair protein RecO (recombination protein O)